VKGKNIKHFLDLPSRAELLVNWCNFGSALFGAIIILVGFGILNKQSDSKFMVSIDGSSKSNKDLIAFGMAIVSGLGLGSGMGDLRILCG
jgi:hypothetical protein